MAAALPADDEDVAADGGMPSEDAFPVRLSALDRLQHTPFETMRTGGFPALFVCRGACYTRFSISVRDEIRSDTASVLDFARAGRC